jgi:nitroimidazol reductase NimA-like FMN-containing flavoprotein (pyridoxamine 5'-phosphate oxidase superfamily)
MTDDEHHIDALDTDECWRLISRFDVGRLAVSISNLPDIFPVNYVVDDGTIVVNTAPGTKLAAAVLGRGVAFEVDDLDHASHTGWSVVVKGTASEIEDLAGLMDAEDLGIETWATSDKTRFLRITPDEVTGRRISRS